MIHNGVQTIWYEGRSHDAIELFRLGAGRWTSSRVDDYQERLAEMRRWVKSIRGEGWRARQEEREADEMPDDLKRRLRALGYVK